MRPRKKLIVRRRRRTHVTVAATSATIHAVVVVLAVVVCAVTVHVFVVVTLTAVVVLTVAVVFTAVAVLTTTTGLTCSVLAATVVLIVTIVVKSPVVSWSCLTVYPPRPQLLGSQRFKGAPARPAMSLPGAPGVGGEAVQAPGSASAQAVGSALPESTAGFVELSPVHAKKPWDFYEALSADRAVSSVVHSSTSSSQGWAGDDNVEQSLLVHVEGFPNDPVEFELARSEGELPSPARSSTVVARFKPPPKGMECVAWQILMRVVEGKELMPDWARRYAQAATKRAKQRLAEESAVGGTGATRNSHGAPRTSASLIKAWSSRGRRQGRPTRHQALPAQLTAVSLPQTSSRLHRARRRVGRPVLTGTSCQASEQNTQSSPLAPGGGCSSALGAAGVTPKPGLQADLA